MYNTEWLTIIMLKISYFIESIFGCLIVNITLHFFKSKFLPVSVLLFIVVKSTFTLNEQVLLLEKSMPGWDKTQLNTHQPIESSQFVTAFFKISHPYVQAEKNFYNSWIISKNFEISPFDFAT